MRSISWVRTDAAHFLFRALPFCYGVTVKATTYYVSPDGNDASSGTTQAQAWQTIARVNQLSFSFQPGDQILFQRGGTYSGSILIVASGTSAQPIVVGAYGSGAKPIITGASQVTGWTNYSGNIWKATLATEPAYVFVNDDLMTLARYPNTGWLTNDNGSPTTLNDADLTQANGYWVGAKAVIRTSNWSYHTPTVTAFNNGLLTYTNTDYNIAGWNWGYYLCDKLSELDMAGEWYYDTASSQLYLWAPGGANPNSLTVDAAVLPTGLSLGWSKHHVTVQNIDFRHFSDAAINLDGNDHITVSNCRFEECYQGMRAGGQDNTISNNTFVRTYGTALFLMDNDVTVEDNTFTDIAMVPGLGEQGWGYFGIRTTGSGVVIRGNQLTNVGYIGIAAVQDALIEKNVLDNAMAIMNDGSAIAFDNSNGMVIQDNIVRTVVGDMTSSASNSPFYYAYGHGIYFGNTSLQNTLIQRNTVTGCSGHGIHMDHTMISTGNQIKDNVLYDNRVQLCISDISNGTTPGGAPPYYVPSFNDVVSGNILYCTDRDQLCMLQYNCYGNTPVDFGTFSSNRYLNPYNEVSIFYFNTYSGQQTYYTLEEWQSDRSEDANSTYSDHRFNDMMATGTVGGVLTPNGDFDYNVNGWVAFPGNSVLTHDQTFLDNGAMKAQLPNNSLYNEMILNGPDQFSIQNGSWYRLRVSTQSTGLGQVKVRVKGSTQMTGPNAAYERKVPFGPERRDLEFFFQSDLADQALIQLASHYTDPTYWIDNIELQQVQVAPIDPDEQQILLVNDGPTVQTFNLTGCWSDVDGGFHSGSIDVAPYRSTILVKEDDASCGLTTGAVEAMASAQATSVLFPNPVSRGGRLQLNAPTTASTLRLLDANGRATCELPPANGRMEWQVPSTLSPGLYIAEIREGSRTVLQRIIVQP